ncbi:hypothetical protein M407DRAFT_135641 [Tulasnella calospora MUT 4182]|uniref:Uncharacterized protein n=1 Tax=Tulasnella calospora MUT 4182 TaxID=1051891 RepID=A0A0C3QRE8_9AGAM|nr:hypothetical protein M407DRAFT_135641 [Tulasnella calospora MUT 4182]
MRSTFLRVPAFRVDHQDAEALSCWTSAVSKLFLWNSISLLCYPVRIVFGGVARSLPGQPPRWIARRVGAIISAELKLYSLLPGA